LHDSNAFLKAYATVALFTRLRRGSGRAWNRY
jgi:hypothetical protein